MVCCFSFITYGLCAPVSEEMAHEGNNWRVLAGCGLEPSGFHVFGVKGWAREVFGVVVMCIAGVYGGCYMCCRCLWRLFHML